MTTYVDRNNVVIKAGDVLLYDEGPGGVRQLHLVLDQFGILVGKVFFDITCGSVYDNDQISLRFYTAGAEGTVCRDALVIPPVSPADLSGCWRAIAATFPGQALAKQFLDHCFSGDVGPDQLRGSAWVAVNQLDDDLTEEGLAKFLAHDFDLNELNGKAGVFVLQLHLEVSGFRATACYMARLTAKAAKGG